MFFTEEEIPPYRCGAGTLITAKSYFVDRFAPACEIIHLPSAKTRGCRISIKVADSPTILSAGYSTGKLRRLKRFFARAAKIAELDGLAIDFRKGAPQNWAHFLDDYMPLLFHILDVLSDVESGDITIVLPSNIPENITTLLDLVGFAYVASDLPIRARQVEYEFTPGIGVRAARYEWVAKMLASAPWVERLFAGRQDYPDKIFISRRDTRRLMNESEIEDFLSKRGYIKIYLEQYSVEDQFRFLAFASDIVSIHGAALAPLLYRPRHFEPFKLVELMPVGHMTNNFRVMADQLGGKWIGVRGKIAPEHVRPAYDFSQPFTKYSLQDFEVDLESLELALNMLE